MVIAILSYNTSILNPALKLLIFFLFCAAAWYFYRCRKVYAGILGQVSTLLLAGSIFGVAAALFRFQGDFYTQYKWGESIFDLCVVTVSLAIALVIRARMKETSRLFGSGDEER